MIEIKEVSKTYDKNSRKARTVLDKASLSLPSTGLVFIVGESGIGKSTILNAVGGLMSYEGKILYDGKEENIEKYRKKNISYIFQDFLLFDELSVRDNIKIALNIAGVYDEDEITKRVSSLLSAVGLHISSGRRASALSLGQRQRVAIARALATSPKIILADEPTGNLDSKNSLNIMEILKALSKTRLVLCVTHNMNLVRLFADEAYIIKNAKFEKLHSLEGNIDDAYKDTSIYLDTMSERDFASDDILLKLYSDNKGDKATIKLIKRGNEVLVIGDNLVIAKPKDVALVTKKEETVESSKSDFKVDESLISFEGRDEKKKWTDNAFLNTLRNMFRRENKKKKAVSKFSNFAQIVCPLIVFILLNSGLIAINEMDNTLGGYRNQYESQITFLGKKKDSEESSSKYAYRSLSNELVAKFLSEDSGIVGGKITSYYKIASSSSSSIFTFEAEGKLLKPSISMQYSDSFRVYDIDEIKNVKGYESLASYSLSDNELVLSGSFFGNGVLSLPCYSNQTYEEALSGTLMHLKTNNYFSTINNQKKKTFLIKGVDHSFEKSGTSSFGTANIYCNNKTANYLKNYFSFFSTYANQFAANLEFLEEFKDYKFYDYSSIQNDARFVMIETGNKDSGGDNIYNLPVVYASEAADSEISSPNNFYSNTLLIKKEEYLIKNSENENEKALYFVDDDSSKIGKSRATFVAELLLNYLAKNRTTKLDSSIKCAVSPSYSSLESAIVIPSALSSLLPSDWSLEDLAFKMNDASWNNTVFGSPSISIAGTYESDDITSPIYVSSGTDLQILNYGNFSVNVGSEYSGYSPEQSAYYYGAKFYSSDVTKTKRYFDSNLETYGVEAVTVSYLYNNVIRKAMLEVYKGIVIASSIIIGVLVLFMALDNVARINKDKNKIGIMRCLGMSRYEIIKDDILANLAKTTIVAIIPTLLLALIFAMFQLYLFGYYIIPFVLAYYLITLLASEIPLLVTVSKDPINIMRTLQ